MFTGIKRLSQIVLLTILFSFMLFGQKALAASVSVQMQNFNYSNSSGSDTAVQLLSTGHSSFSGSKIVTETYSFPDVLNTAYPNYNQPDGLVSVTVTASPTSINTTTGTANALNVSATILITQSPEYQINIYNPYFFYSSSNGSIISISPTTSQDGSSPPYPCAMDVNGNPIPITFNDTVNLTALSPGTSDVSVRVSFLLATQNHTPDNKNGKSYCADPMTGPVSGQTFWGTVAVAPAQIATYTVSAPCSISSFTATNPTPPYGQTTDLSFILSGGTFDWNIKELNSGSTTSTSPRSGNGSGTISVSTSATSGSQTYHLTCDPLGTNVTRDVSVIHPLNLPTATLQVSTDNVNWVSGVTVTAPQSGQTGPTLYYRWLSTNTTSGSSTASAIPSSCPGQGAWSATGTSGSTSDVVASNKAGCTYTMKYTATSSSGSAESDITVTINVPPPVSCLPSSQSISVGGTAGLSASGGDGTYSWSAPGGSPSTGTGGTLNVSYSTAGTQNVTVNSNGTSYTCSVNVIDSLDFNLDPNPTGRTISSGQVASYTVSAIGINGFSSTSPISLSALSLPSGATPNFNPVSTIYTTTLTTLNIVTSTSIPPNNYNFILRGVSGSLSHDVPMSFIVSATTSTTATLQVSTDNINWSSSATVNAPQTGQVGPTLWYRWSSTNAVDGSSISSSNPVSCPGGGTAVPWVASGTGGNTSGVVTSDQAGCTYTIAYSAVSSLTTPFNVASSTIIVTINNPGTTGSPTPTPTPTTSTPPPTPTPATCPLGEWNAGSPTNPVCCPIGDILSGEVCTFAVLTWPTPPPIPSGTILGVHPPTANFDCSPPNSSCEFKLGDTINFTNKSTP